MKKIKGFTLVELLVVISIIGVLIGLSLSAFTGARKTARDGKRKADLEQIRSALEMCRADYGSYPSSVYTSGNVQCGTPQTGIKVYLSGTPLDPSTKDQYYYSGTTNTYTLCAYLETGLTQEICCAAGACCGSGRVCNYKTNNP
jgi:general secretion pathway protein G